MEGRQPNRLGEALTPRQKRVFASVSVLVAVLLAALGIWAAVTPGSYGRSSNGCVTVVAPSTTGGGILHECGAAAHSMCEKAYSHNDRISLLTRSQCTLAGIAPAGHSGPTPTP